MGNGGMGTIGEIESLALVVSAMIPVMNPMARGLDKNLPSASSHFQFKKSTDVPRHHPDNI